MKQTPEQPDLFDPKENKSHPDRIQIHPPDLDVWRSTGYGKISQSRDSVLKQSDVEILSPHETHLPQMDDEFKYYDPRKATSEDVQKVVDVVHEATQEDDQK